MLSLAGVAAVSKGTVTDEGVSVKADTGQLVQLHEKRSGALDRIVESPNIRIFGKPEWGVIKARLNWTVSR